LPPHCSLRRCQWLKTAVGERANAQSAATEGRDPGVSIGAARQGERATAALGQRGVAADGVAALEMML